MMAAEGPFIAAVIARLPDAKFNLAAYGVALAFAMLVEAPVIMIMSASTALVEDAASFYKLRNFIYGLNAAVTGLMLVLLAPPIFEAVVRGLMGVPGDVADLTHAALALFLPWPAAIGYRRFFQGLMIRGGRTRLVAYGTVVRLATMTAVGFGLYEIAALPGAYVGGAALTAGVCAEAVASRLMARATVRRLLQTGSASGAAPALSYGRIFHFYYPLALTSLLGLAVQPMTAFFMGRARHPVESLAVLPVVNALSFIFRAPGLSFQEVGIALFGKKLERYAELARFALWLGLAASLGQALVAFTPLAHVWFQTVSGLSPELAAFALAPARILTPLAALMVLLAFQRAVLVHGRRTRPITAATALEVTGIVLTLLFLTRMLSMVGATAAAIALVAGRVAANAYLQTACDAVRHEVGQ
jgi:hypothetical protein